MDSKLQIISGTYRGRKLQMPQSARPTQNRARIALFNMLTGIYNNAQPAVVWDAFAGSGAFGIECLSRWNNARVIFTDLDSDAVKVLRRNVAGMPTDKLGIVCADALASVNKYGSAADLIYLDPPYGAADVGAKFVRKLADVAHSGAILVWEQDAQNLVVPDENAWEILRQRQYGRAVFYILYKKDK